MVTGSVVNFDLVAYASPRRKQVEERLAEYLAGGDPDKLWESMRYSVLSGGKRIRALLCLASAESVAHMCETQLDAAETALPCAAAIEMVHAMSLIHDDLPCMDDDDFRRGKATNHKVFGEAMALLAGDALLVMATETLLRKTSKAVGSDALVDVAAELARATGPEGMVGGQVADSIATGLVPSEGKNELTPALLESIHRRKTGALLRFSCWSGARLMNAPAKVLAALAEFGEILGLAFQIADDLLDLTGDLQTLGKTPGKDQATGKLTWVSVYGIEGSQKALTDLQTRGNAVLERAGLPEKSAAPLMALLNQAINRTS